MKHILLLLILSFFIINNLKSQPTEIAFSFYNLGCGLKKEAGIKSKPKKTANPKIIIIKNKEELRRITACSDDYSFDFNKFIIIGLEGAMSGCSSPEVSFKVYKDQFQRKIIVDATISKKGLCRGFFAYHSFIIIEKHNDDYAIDIKTIKD